MKAILFALAILPSNALAYQYREYQIITPPYIQESRDYQSTPLYQPVPSGVTVPQPEAKPYETHRTLSPLPTVPYWQRGEMNEYNNQRN